MQDNQGIISPECWTAIVPAAGRGSRLGFDQPKILFPVAGRPILDWLLEFFAAGFVSRRSGTFSRRPRSCREGT